MELISNIYAVISLATSIFLVHLINKIRKSKIDTRKHLIAHFSVGFVAGLSYAFFLLSDYYSTAIIMLAIFYICTDWLLFTMFNVAAHKMVFKGNKRKSDVVFSVLACVDSISMLVNTKTHHSFELIQSFTDNGFGYWGVVFSPFHFIHLGFCYVIVISTFAVFAVNSIKAPKYYKNKYVAFMISYLLVILANFISYMLNLSVDFSVLFYGILAAFVSHYSLYTFPNQLMMSVLSNVNAVTSNIIVHFDYNGKIVYENDAAKRFFSKEIEFFHKSAGELRDECEKNQITNLDFIDEKTKLEKHYRIEYKDLELEDKKVGSYLLIQDKTDEVIQFQRERYNATHDELTGLLNRTGFFEAVKNHIKAKTFKNPIMLCSNIKDFKLINDIFGEETGDRVLKLQAEMMKEFAHVHNINGRLNDDKFALFMEKNDFNPDIFKSGADILKQAAKNSAYQMVVHCGIYEVLNQGENVQVMYDKAKLAMDTITEEYGKMFSWYDSNLMDRLLAEKNIVNEFDNALENGQFDFYLQPSIDSEGKRSAVEVLVRWNNPKRGILTPGEFLLPLEKSGLLCKLDGLTFEKVVQMRARWDKECRPDVRVAVNLSSRNKYFFNDYEFLINTVKKYDVEAKNFILEVEEAALIEDFESGQNIFKKLKNAGFEISIDHFGTGYSSLNLLKDFMVNGIKVSADFLKEDEFSEKSRVILSTMISMARNLDMLVIAYGIEKEDQIEQLKTLGCNRFQGFYFDKPMTVSAFEKKYL